VKLTPACWRKPRIEAASPPVTVGSAEAVVPPGEYGSREPATPPLLAASPVIRSTVARVTGKNTVSSVDVSPPGRTTTASACTSYW